MTVETRPELLLVDDREAVGDGREAVTGDRSVLVDDVTAALERRLEPMPTGSLRAMVQDAIERLGEVRVTTYLPILVERDVREQLRRTA